MIKEILQLMIFNTKVAPKFSIAVIFFAIYILYQLYPLNLIDVHSLDL